MIAISYRRQDSSPVAGRLYDRLQAEFGKGSVFMDFDSIPYGVDFREHIKQTLQRAKVVVAIIGPEWTGGAKDLSNRRIDDPTDFVRLEVASALENGIPIIPVLVNNTPMPEAKNLPAELEGLAFRNGLALDTGIDFHHHADRLIAGIHRVVDPPKGGAPITSESETPAASETAREHVFTGKVGNKEATFRFRFEQGAHVVGTYTQGGSTYRLDGRHPKGRMLLDEYTGERLTAHIEVSLVESATLIRWEGTMRNTPPDNRVLPIYFERTVGPGPAPSSLTSMG